MTRYSLRKSFRTGVSGKQAGLKKMVKKNKILVVDDSQDLCELLSMALTDAGYLVKVLYCGGQVVKEVLKNPPDLVLLDVSLPDADGRELLKELKKIDKTLVVIMMTGAGGAKDVVDAIKAGAFDYIVKPFINEELLLVVKRALENRSLHDEMNYLKSELAKKSLVSEMIGESPAFQQMLKKIKTVAQTNITVVLHGESGVGKELVADMIHRESLRRDKPYIPVDCGAIPDNLVESELFGHKKGAFTGALADRKGKFEQADGGTLFLDEVTNLPEVAQVKLLRVLEDHKVWCLGGGAKAADVDVRIIAASNIDLTAAVKQNKFRNDLFHRLNEFYILIPPLRERKEDIALIASHFIKKANREFNKSVKGITSEALKRLLAYRWPGNIRELRNVIKMAVLSTESDHITASNLPLTVNEHQQEHTDTEELNPEMALEDVVRNLEGKLIRDALVRAGGNKVKAAALLHLDRKSLYRKMSKLGIS
ncbi:MAG: sigma-54 dependent transcriptional regulator [Lentisphaerota bacterium]